MTLHYRQSDARPDEASVDTYRIRDELIELRSRLDANALEVSRLWQRMKFSLSSARAGFYFATVLSLLLLCILSASYAIMHGWIDTRLRPATTTEKRDLQELLTLFGPALTLLVTVFLAVFGARRLQSYDSEFRHMREELNSRLATFDENQRKQFDRFESSTKAIVESAMSSALAGARSDYEKAYKEKSGEIKEIASETLESIQLALGKLQPYAWLNESAELRRNVNSVASVGEAQTLMTDLFSKRERDAAIAVARQIATDASLSGSSVDYFNASAELGRHNQEALALSVCQRGLAQNPDDVDLLSQAMQYATEIGRISDAQTYYDRLSHVDLGKWNWRAYMFSADYLARANKPSEEIGILEAAIKAIPSDERLYERLAVANEDNGSHEKADEIRQKAVSSLASVAQVGGNLAIRLLELGRYEEALVVCDRALISTARSQPTFNQAALIWTRANVFDALTLKEISESEIKRSNSDERIDQIITLARKAISNYNLACKMPRAHQIYEMQRQLRLSVLHARLGEFGAQKAVLAELFGNGKNASDDEMDLPEEVKDELRSMLVGKLNLK